MKYLKEYKDGDRVLDVYLCKHKQSATTKNGKSYDNLILQDKTGVMDAKGGRLGSRGGWWCAGRSRGRRAEDRPGRRGAGGRPARARAPGRCGRRASPSATPPSRG